MRPHLSVVLLCALVACADSAPWYVELDWDEVWGATSYDLEISVDDPTFTPPLYDQEPLQVPWKKINVEPILSRTYYWRVRGVGHGGTTEWSNDGVAANQYFKVQPESTLPVCLGPGSDHEVSSSSVGLAWTYVPFATYHVTITEQGAGSPAFTTTTGNTALQVPLAPGKTYTYRVHTTGPNGIDGETAPNPGDCTIKTKAEPPPPLPCGTIAQAGGETPDTRTYELGVNHGTMRLHWRTFTVKDQILVWYGGTQIWDSTCVSSPDPYNTGSAGTGAEQEHVMSYSGSSTAVTIQIVPHCDSSQPAGGTEWDYEMDCP